MLYRLRDGDSVAVTKAFIRGANAATTSKAMDALLMASAEVLEETCGEVVKAVREKGQASKGGGEWDNFKSAKDRG